MARIDEVLGQIEALPVMVRADSGSISVAADVAEPNLWGRMKAWVDANPGKTLTAILSTAAAGYYAKREFLDDGPDEQPEPREDRPEFGIRGDGNRITVPDGRLGEDPRIVIQGNDNRIEERDEPQPQEQP